MVLTSALPGGQLCCSGGARTIWFVCVYLRCVGWPQPSWMRQALMSQFWLCWSEKRHDLTLYVGAVLVRVSEHEQRL